MSSGESVRIFQLWFYFYYLLQSLPKQSSKWKLFISTSKAFDMKLRHCHFTPYHKKMSFFVTVVLWYFSKFFGGVLFKDVWIQCLLLLLWKQCSLVWKRIFPHLSYSLRSDSFGIYIYSVFCSLIKLLL